LLLFGGERSKNVFSRLFEYRFDEQKWITVALETNSVLNFPESVSNHSATLLRDKIYVFGGDERGDHLFCLDLKTSKWEQYGGTAKDETNTDIPPHRFDHMMWSDKTKGSAGSVYVLFGSFYRDDMPMQSFQRRDMWRFDVASKKWSSEPLSGNFPAYRAESETKRRTNLWVFITNESFSLICTLHVKPHLRGFDAQHSKQRLMRLIHEDLHIFCLPRHVPRVQSLHQTRAHCARDLSVQCLCGSRE
jgi:hypothetical protein